MSDRMTRDEAISKALACMWVEVNGRPVDTFAGWLRKFGFQVTPIDEPPGEESK